VWTRDSAITYLSETFHTLRVQSDLSPGNETVTRCLYRLVRTLNAWHQAGFGDDLADAPELAEARTELPTLCAAAEHTLEKWWCRKALASDAPARVLAGFWYLANYRSLCRAEADLAGMDALREAVFLGCGALPLSAILMAQSDNAATLRCVDADAQSCELAAALVRALGLDGRITVEHARAEGCDIPRGGSVICASLLDAPGLYAHLADHGAERVLVRDALGVYQWLYRPALLPGPVFRECARTQPAPERINITRYFEVVHEAQPATDLAAGISCA